MKGLQMLACNSDYLASVGDSCTCNSCIVPVFLSAQHNLVTVHDIVAWPENNA